MEQPQTRFAADVYRDRLDRAARAAAAAGLDGMVIGTGADLDYLIGSRAESFERLTALVVRADAAATVVLPRLERAALRASAAESLALKVREWVDGQDPYALVAADLGGERFAVDAAMPALHVLALIDRIGRVPAPATEVLAGLRMVKDTAEIAALRRAGAAIDRVHARMGEWLLPGRTEAEVHADITAAILAEGHTAAAFVIVGSGPNGADPHHEVSDRVLRAGDTVVIDIGGPVDVGYHSDCTRTYHLGEPDPELLRRYAVLEAAQQAAVDHARPGVTAESVDAAARSVLAEAGLAEAFVHRTGHGIGLSVHEEPYIVAGNDFVLGEGMAFSIEPGVYFPGQWGARIEDIVVLTADGCQRLNNRPRALGVLPA